MQRTLKFMIGLCVLASCLIHVSCASSEDPRVWNQRQLTVVTAFVQELEGRRLDLRSFPLKFDQSVPGALAAKLTVKCDSGPAARITCDTGENENVVLGGKDNLGCWTKEGDTATYKLCSNGGKPIIREDKPKEPPVS